MGSAVLPSSLMAEREVFRREYRDPDAYTIANGLVSSRVVGRSSEHFSARVAKIDVGRVRLRKGEATVPVTMIGAVGDLHAFTFSTRPSAPRLLSGREVPYRTIFHFRPNEMMYGTSPSGQPWPFGSVVIPYDIMLRYGEALAGFAISPRRDDMTLFQVSEANIQRLVSLLVDAERVAVEQPEIALHPIASQAMSGAVIDALVTCLLQGERRRDRAATRRYATVIARLEQAMVEQPEDMLSLPDICAAVGVAERTLLHACQEFLGMGAMQYARLRRLDNVQMALITGDPLHDTVSEIAMRFGFWELGRFAGIYRARYGEMPSATLRRSGPRRLH